MLSKLSIRFFGAAVAGARFFFGFRPRLLGIGKQWVAGTPSAISSHAFGLKALRSALAGIAGQHREKAGRQPQVLSRRTPLGLRLAGIPSGSETL